MVLQNYVVLQPGLPARMHFTDHVKQVRTITDPQTGRATTRNVLVFDVDELNGQPVVSQLSTMAAGLADKFEAYLPSKTYQNYNFTITQTGTGFMTKYTLLATPR